MSLINDALKQAKAAQPVKAAPALKAVEREQRSRGPGLLLPALIVVILLMAALLLWQWFSKSGSAELTVRARTAPEVSSVPKPEPVHQVIASPVQAPAMASVPVSNTAVAATPKADVAVSAPDVTNTVATAEPAKPEPPAYKLQSIFFSPKNPSAVISGKMVSVGEKVKGAQVISIKKESVTIVTPTGETKVMELAD